MAEKKRNSDTSSARVAAERWRQNGQKRKHLSRDELIERVSTLYGGTEVISSASLQKIEQGTRRLTPGNAAILAKALSVGSDDPIRPEYLLGEDDFRTERQYNEWKYICAEFDRGKAINANMMPAFFVIVQDILNQGQNKGDYMYRMQSSPDGDGLAFEVRDGFGNSVILDSPGYLSDLWDEAIDFLRFKLDRHIRRSLLAKQLEYMDRKLNSNKEQDGQ